MAVVTVQKLYHEKSAEYLERATNPKSKRARGVRSRASPLRSPAVCIAASILGIVTHNPCQHARALCQLKGVGRYPER